MRRACDDVPECNFRAERDGGTLTQPEDLNGDGVVDTEDLLLLLAAWGDCPDPPEDCPADFDGNGVVGTADLLALQANWG
jgi:hypothetical protein